MTRSSLLVRLALAGASRALTNGSSQAQKSCSFSAACSELNSSSSSSLWRRSVSSSLSSSRLAEDDRRRQRSFASAASAPSNQLQLIKALREKSGAPVTDVKAALVEAEWDEGEKENKGKSWGESIGIDRKTTGSRRLFFLRQPRFDL